MKAVGFTLIETIVMLGAFLVFTFLLAGLTKPYWGDAKLTTLNEAEQEETSNYIIDESYLPDAKKGAVPELKEKNTISLPMLRTTPGLDR